MNKAIRILGSQSQRRSRPMPARQAMRQRLHAGFTITELMVSLALSLLLIGGTISIYLNNKQSLALNEDIASIQENGRLAMELISREIREAGSTPCGHANLTSVIRSGGATPWWAHWNAGTLVGYDDTQASPIVAFGTASASRVKNTDAIAVLRAASNDDQIHKITAHNLSLETITLDATGGLDVANKVVACDESSGAIFQITSVRGKTIGYGGIGGANCTNMLGYPLPDDCTAGSAKIFNAGGTVSELDSAYWYIGNNSRGKTSLYRASSSTPVEMVPDVSDMQIEYLTRDSTISAPALDLATAWVSAADLMFSDSNGGWREVTVGGNAKNNKEVVAVRITLTLSSPNGISVEGVPLTRRTLGAIKLRNREIKS